MTVMLKCLTTLSSGVSGPPGVTTLFWRPGTGGGSVADATDIAARVRAMWFAQANRFVSGAQLQVQGVMEAVEDTTGQMVGIFAGTQPGAVAGTGAQPELPSAVALLVQARTSTVLNGRFLRGRTFISALNTAQCTTDGQVLAGAGAAFVGGFTGLLTGGSTASFPVVWHRPNAGGPGSSFPVASYTVPVQFAVLRSRRD